MESCDNDGNNKFNLLLCAGSGHRDALHAVVSGNAARNFRRMKRHTRNHSERGTAIVEFALTSAFFLMMIMAIVSAGHLFFTHNALVESTRRGARYAATLAKPATGFCANNSTTV